MSLGYVNFQRYTDLEPNYTAVDPDPDPDTPLLDVMETSTNDDHDALLNSPVADGVSILKNSKYSITTLLLAILCVFLATGLIVVTLMWATSNKTGNKNKRESDSLKHFFQISDTHLDIYYDSNVTNKKNQGCRNVKNKGGGDIVKSKTTAIYGRIQCDSPAVLLESLKTHLGKVKDELDNDVEFILMTGDQAGHSYSFFEVDALDSVLWSIANSTKYISDGLPGIPIFMTVGNNDLKIDYDPPVSNHSAFYKKLYHIFQPYVFPQGSDVHVLNSKEQFRTTFELGGYYSIILDGGKMLLVVLNTNYWAAKSYKENKNVTTIGNLQMNWLHYQLNAAKLKKQKVIIAGHIPPGISSYNGSSFWLTNYTNVYNMMMTMKFPHVVIAQIYGHIHSDRIKLQYLNDPHNKEKSTEKSFLLTCPSVTPVYANNPAFRVYDYNSKKQQLMDYNQYYMDLAASNVNKEPYWFKEYSFADMYKVDLTTEGVEQIVNKFLDPSSSAWFHYSQHIKTKMGGTPYYQRYHEYCTAKHVNIEMYKECTEAFDNIGV